MFHDQLRQLLLEGRCLLIIRCNLPYHRAVSYARLALAAAASQQRGGFTGLRGALMSRGFHCGQISVTRSYYTISVPLEFPCYYDIVGRTTWRTQTTCGRCLS